MHLLLQIDWYRDSSSSADTASGRVTRSATARTDIDGVPVDARPIASGKRLVVSDGRYRVYRPHNSALSVLIIRRAKKRDAGIYRCNLAGSTTRHKYMVLNVTGQCVHCITNSEIIIIIIIIIIKPWYSVSRVGSKN